MSFWRRVREECDGDAVASPRELEALARKVWGLGSIRHMEAWRRLGCAVVLFDHVRRSARIQAVAEALTPIRAAARFTVDARDLA